MQTDEVPVPAKDATKPEEPKEQPKTVGESLKSVTAVLETATKLKDTRVLAGRVMRLTAAFRKQLTGEVLRHYIEGSLAADLESKPFLLSHVEKVSAGEDVPMQAEDSPAQAVFTESSTPEVELFAFMLVATYLVDKKACQQLAEVTTRALERLSAFNRRTLDVIAARLYSYHSWAYECLGKLEDIRSALLSLHRTATLRHDTICAETLATLLLRNYLHYGLYDQAEKFRSKAVKEDAVWRSHQQYVRYLLYLGRIRAIQLEYSEARDCLHQASRRAPTSALGFRVAADKWLILVRLLLGEVPDRMEFAVPGLVRPLEPYFDLARAVRAGDMRAFAQVAERHAAVFAADATRNLVTRLSHNVLRTGLRRLSTAYSRISLADVAAKLHLPSPDDAEFIVAKAIRDGGVSAVIDREAGAMVTREPQDVYASGEPCDAFHVRTAFCLDLHNEAVKAMRFEPNTKGAGLESAEARAERLAAEAELAQALEEEEDF